MPALQIRDVPEDVHRTLKSRAALAGVSLADYALAELRRAAERPTVEELIERVRALPPVVLPQTSADLVRELRGT